MSDFFNKLQAAFTPDKFSTAEQYLEQVSCDESGLAGVMPCAVVRAENADDVISAVRLAREFGIPVTARGSGTSLEGSSIPCKDGLVINLSRMDRIFSLGPDDMLAVAEPGIIYDKLNQKIKHTGLFFPPCPGGSSETASIGGMVATNASGIYTVRYGATRDYVLSLDVITGAGEKITFGNLCRKSSSGYSLKDIIIGSEGTLGIITKIALRLAARPVCMKQIAFTFNNIEEAVNSSHELVLSVPEIAALEILDQDCIRVLNSYGNYGISENPSLFIELHGKEKSVHESAGSAESLCTQNHGKSIDLHDLWSIRKNITNAVRQQHSDNMIIRLDFAVPVSSILHMAVFSKDISEKEEIQIYFFGHSGSGIIHCLIPSDRENIEHIDRGKRIRTALWNKALSLGGSTSGEHGIGIGSIDFAAAEHGRNIEFMKEIKKIFDPDNIMNPGKIFT
jgi:D-lactate dehydrogenase (cytochrome)